MAAPTVVGLGLAQGGNGITLSPHASSTTGDYMLCIMGNRGSAGTIDGTNLTADGWVELADSPQSINEGDDESARLTVYYKRHTGTQSGVAVSVSSGFATMVGWILTLRDVLPATGEATHTSIGGTESGDNTLSITGDTTTQPDALVVALVDMLGDLGPPTISNWANASLSSFGVQGVNNLNNHGLGVATGIKTSAGTFGATTADLDMSFPRKAFLHLSFLGAEPPGPGEPGEEVPYEPPAPARALIEIYVPDPEAYRWGEAIWGPPSVWSTAQWTDITMLCVSADIQWGVSRPDAGILSDTEAGLWTVITYDPDRVLDPANEDSPYYPAITYSLPIRISHRNRVIRTGFCESISFSYESDFGEIRATDHVAMLAAATVPEDVSLSDTLVARAIDVIAAAGIPMSVVPIPGTDPPLAPWEPGSFSAWDIIRESAREVHHIPLIDNVTRLGFRAWDSPLDRNGVIGSPEMIELVPFISADSLYSVVQVNDATAMTEVERRITPLPRYGERVHRRTLATINGGDWADRVLEDRAQSGLRWRPGALFPIDADSVEYLANIDINEFLTIDYPEASPDVEVRVRVLGARLRVVDLGGQAGPDWRWWFATATSFLSPLEADDITPIEYLVDDDTGELLYPDGVVGLE